MKEGSRGLCIGEEAPDEVRPGESANALHWDICGCRRLLAALRGGDAMHACDVRLDDFCA
jgi:hypothetical protein